MMRMLSISALAVCISVLLTGCDTEPVETETRLRSVKTVTVGSANTNRVHIFSGVSKSSQVTRLSFKVTGSVESLPVSVGDSLHAGQLIARLDDSIYQLQSQQAEADLARAKAEERNAASSYKRTRDLYENSNASKNDLDAKRAANESAEAQVNASKRALQLARLNISYTKLKVQEACSVASVSIEIGENVSPGQEIAMVNCGDSIEIDLSVPESIIGSLRAGQTAKVMFDAIPNQSFDGIVKDVGIASTGGSTFPVSVAIDGEQSGLRSGMAAQVRFELAMQASNGYTVPTSAVGEDQVGRFVYVLQTGQKDGIAVVQRQAVKVGELMSDGIEITQGLSAGDEVVTAGLSVIRDGLQVKAN